MEVKVTLDEGAKLPIRAHKEDAGLDLYSMEDYVLFPGKAHTFDTGVHMAIPEGYAGFVKSKSGLMVNNGIFTDGVVDCGYTGSIRVCLFNFGQEAVEFQYGMKLAQLVILPVECCDLKTAKKLGKSSRGDSGFGSTGKA